MFLRFYSVSYSLKPIVCPSVRLFICSSGKFTFGPEGPFCCNPPQELERSPHRGAEFLVITIFETLQTYLTLLSKKSSECLTCKSLTVERARYNPREDSKIAVFRFLPGLMSWVSRLPQIVGRVKKKYTNVGIKQTSSNMYY